MVRINPIRNSSDSFFENKSSDVTKSPVWMMPEPGQANLNSDFINISASSPLHRADPRSLLSAFLLEHKNSRTLSEMYFENMFKQI